MEGETSKLEKPPIVGGGFRRNRNYSVAGGSKKVQLSSDLRNKIKLNAQL